MPTSYKLSKKNAGVVSLTCVLGRTRAHIVRHDGARGHIIPFHVHHQKVMPLPLAKAQQKSIWL